MNIFTNLWLSWTIYEKLTVSLTWFGIFLLVLAITWFLTKNISFILVETISFLSIVVLSLGLVIATHFAVELPISEILMIIPIFTIFINILNLGTFLGYYSNNHESKDFDLGDIKREFVSDTIKMTIIATLSISIIIAFTSAPFSWILGISGFVSLAQIWINYYLIYRLVK